MKIVNAKFNQHIAREIEKFVARLHLNVIERCPNSTPLIQIAVLLSRNAIIFYI